MECKNYREQFPSFLINSLHPNQRSEIESHLESCSDCREEFEAAKKVWNLMGEIDQPEPSESMQADFNATLSNFKKEQVVRESAFREWFSKLREFLYLQVQPRLVYSLLLVTIGLVGGYILHQPEQSATSYNKQIDSLTSQVSEMKQVMIFSLLQNPSASKRISAVAYTEDIANVDFKVIDALFTTLNEDPNVNVRLATLDALVRLAEEPKVREGLVQSIELQESPLMQTSIADVMVKLQEKSSIRSLQKLLDKKDLNQKVKFNIEKSIQKLI